MTNERTTHVLPKTDEASRGLRRSVFDELVREHRALIRRALEEGFTDAQIARAFGATEELVRSVRQVNAIPRRRGTVTPIHGMPHKTYTAEEKAQTLIALDSNEGNVKKTARETGVPVGTIRSWRASSATEVNGAPAIAE